MARKAIKTISITGTGATTGGGVVEATIAGGESVETDAIAAYGDTYFTNVPRPVKQQGDVSVTFLTEGAVEGLAVGTVVSATLTYTYSDGKTDGTPVTVTRDMVVVSSEGNSVAVDGERKATATVVLRPHTAPASNDSNA